MSKTISYQNDRDRLFPRHLSARRATVDEVREQLRDAGVDAALVASARIYEVAGR